MKRSKRRACSLLLLLLILLLCGCDAATGAPETGESERASASRSEWWTEEEDEPEQTEYEYTEEIDESVLDAGGDLTYLLLANKEHPLGEGYVPEGLTRLTCPTTYPMDLESRAAAALYEMLREMAGEGVDCSDFLVTSAYRSYRLQKELFEGYVAAEMAAEGGFSPEAYAALGEEYLTESYLSKGIKQLTYEDAMTVARSYSAEAGQSEHQTGLCVDFITEDMNDSLTVAFEEKEEFFWLRENAYRFGFILRYPKEKESVTGYTYEPWHYRFVGREAATAIHAGGLTLEEYVLAPAA